MALAKTGMAFEKILGENLVWPSQKPFKFL
jgi:hypothetical protein